MAASNQTVVPMLSYRDGLAALTWLAEAFGFVERTRHVGHDGRLAHGEMMAGDNIIMLATPSAEYEGPTLHRFHCKHADEWLSVPWIVDGVLVHVADVASRLARARAHGARVLSEMEDGPPGRRYRVEDLEGHRWMFMERPTQK